MSSSAPTAIRDDVVDEAIAALKGETTRVGPTPLPGEADQPIRGDVVGDAVKFLDQTPNPVTGFVKGTAGALGRSVLSGAQSYLVPAALAGNPFAPAAISLTDQLARKLPEPSGYNEFAAEVGTMKDEPWYSRLYGGLGAAAYNPASVLEAAAQSLPAYGMTAAPATLLGTVIGTAAAPGPGTIAGTVLGAGAGSLWLDATSTFLDSFREQGVDVGDPVALYSAFQNPELLEKAGSSAIRHGLPVAAFDALSAGLAGRLMGPVKNLLKSASAPVRHVAEGAAEVAAQGALGGTGEALGQLAQGRDKIDMADVIAEVIGEMGGTPFEVAQTRIGQALGKVKASGSGQQASAQAPPATPPAPSSALPVPSSSNLSFIPDWVKANPEKARQMATLKNASRNGFDRVGFPVLNLEAPDRARALDEVRKAVLQHLSNPQSEVPSSALPAPSSNSSPSTGALPSAAPPPISSQPSPDGAPPADENTTETGQPNIGTTPTPEEPPPAPTPPPPPLRARSASEGAAVGDDAESSQPSAVSDQPTPPSESPDVSLSRAIEERLRTSQGKPLTRDELYTLADEHYKGTRAEGTYGPSDVDDAAETALHRIIQGLSDPAADLASAKEQAEMLSNLTDLLPTQRNRSGEKSDFQQFSTPPAYAFAANWIANPHKGDTILEPSAGTGGLLVHAKNSGARTIVNEISERRSKLLSTLNPSRQTTGDAEHIDVHTAKDRPTLVVMNPPFSRSGQRLGDKMDLAAGARHVMAALKALQPGGRLVAIVGGGMDSTKAAYRDFYRQVARKFDLRANVVVNGDVYEKYGTKYDSRVLVIDKPLADSSKLTAVSSVPLATGRVDTIPDLLQKLEGVRNDRPSVANLAPGSDQPSGDEAAPTAPDGGEGRPVGRPGTGQAGDAADIPGGGAARTTVSIAEHVMAGNTVRLQGGLSLERRKVGGEPRLEISGATRADARSLASMGAFNEKIGGFSERWFIPVAEGKPTDATVRILDEVLKYAPVTAIESEEESDAYRPAGSPVQQGSRGRPVSTSPSASPRRITADWIVRWMADRFDVPIRYGRVTLAGAAGIYRHASELIRVRGKDWGNLYVHGHELAHHIDKALRANPKDRYWTSSLPQSVRDELGTIDYDQTEKRPHEGFAEYIARTYINHEDLSGAVPLAAQAIEAMLDRNPRLKTDLLQLENHVRGLQSQTALERVLGQIKDDGQPLRLRPESFWGNVRQTVSEWADTAYTKLLEAGSGFEKFDKAAAEKAAASGKAAAGPGQRAIDVYRYNRRGMLRWGKDAFDRGAFLLSDPGNIIGPSFGDFMKALDDPKDFDNAVAYMTSVHALDAHDKGIEPGISREDAQAVVDQFDHRDDFKRMHAILSQMNDALLDVQTDQGQISEKAAKAARDEWGDRYLPLFKVRQLDHGQAAALKGAEMSMSAFKRRTGSSAPIVNPVAATMWKYMAVYDQAGQAQIRNVVLDRVNTVEGLSKFALPFPPKQRMSLFTAEEVRTQLEQAGLDPSAMDDVEPDTAIRIFRPDLYGDRANPNVWPRYEADGKAGGSELKQYEVSNELARSVAALKTPAETNAFLRLAAVATRIMRFGATSASDTFLVKNPIRDVQTYSVQGEGNLLERVFSPLYEYGRAGADKLSGLAAKAGLAIPGHDPVRQLFERVHAGVSSATLGYRPGAKDILATVRPEGPLKRVLSFAFSPRTLVEANEFAESMPRLAAFRYILNKHGFNEAAIASGRVPPLNVLVEASNAAADATVDFSRRGEWGDLNGIFLFANAILQSNARFVKNFTSKEAFMKALPGLSLMALATLGYWYRVKDQDWWKASKDWAKYNNWVYAPGGDQGSPLLRIPFAQETAAWFQGPLLALLDGMYQKDKTVGGELMHALYGGLANQVPSIPLLGPGLEVAMNYDTFKERPIETRDMQRLKAEDRFNPSTTMVARGLGKAIGETPLKDVPILGGLSPAKIDHLLDGYSGGLFRRMVRPLERLVTGEKGTSRDIPFLSGLTFGQDPVRDVSDLYDAADNARQALASAKANHASTPELEERAHTLGRYEDIVSEIHKNTRDVRGRGEREETERYVEGLSRRALGRPELAKYPDPIAHPAENAIVRAAVDHALGTDVVQATAPHPEKQKHETLEHYKSRVDEWQLKKTRAEAMLRSTGYTAADLSRLLREKGASENWDLRSRDPSGKVTSFGLRLRRLAPPARQNPPDQSGAAAAPR